MKLYVVRENKATGVKEYKQGKISMDRWVDAAQKESCWQFSSSCCQETLRNVVQAGSPEYVYYFESAEKQ